MGTPQKAGFGSLAATSVGVLEKRKSQTLNPQAQNPEPKPKPLEGHTAKLQSKDTVFAIRSSYIRLGLKAA